MEILSDLEFCGSNSNLVLIEIEWVCSTVHRQTICLRLLHFPFSIRLKLLDHLKRTNSNFCEALHEEVCRSEFVK